MVFQIASTHFNEPVEQVHNYRGLLGGLQERTTYGTFTAPHATRQTIISLIERGVEWTSQQHSLTVCVCWGAAGGELL